MAQENTKQQGYTCTGDCLRCSQAQRQYCASQFTFNNMQMLESLSQSVLALANDVKNLNEKIEVITNTESMLFNPSAQTEETESKKIPPTEETSAITASGAENRLPK